DFNSGSLRIRDWAPRRDIEEYGLLVGNASLLYNVNVPDVDVDPLYAYAGVMSGYWVFDDGGRFAENMMMRTYLVSNVSDYNYEPLGGLVTNSIPPPSNLFWNSPSQFELRSGFDTDSDGDGLLDAWEVLHHLNPGNATGVNGADGDPDGDGLTNLDEYNAGTDPQNWDTDGNGVADGLEDSDGDGLSNADECNLFGTNPFLADSDDDGYDDGAEISNLKPDPADNFGIYRALTSPTDSISPFIPRSFVMSGSGLAGPELNDTARFALVYAEAANSNGPIVTITEPVSNANVAVRYLAVRGTVQSAVALQAVKLYNNGQFVISLGGVTSFDKTIILNSGTNRLEVIATDADGQQGSAQVSVNGTFARAAIRVTQNWNVAGDLDTWLVDPLGRTRGFTSSGPGLPQHVATQIPGSILDIDDIQGVGPENITIMEGLTTNGNYEVWMDNFSNQGNPQSTVRVLVLEGLPGQQYVEFGPQSMPVSDYNGNNAAAWWHVTTINMPSGTMNPPGTPLTDTPVTDTDPITGITSLVGWTIEAWMKPGTNLQSGAVAKYMLDDGRLGYCVGLSSNQPFVRLGLATGGTNQPSYQALAGQLPANVWSHVAWVYSQTENSLRIYVNGTLTVAQQLLESRAVGSGSLTVDTYDTVPGRTFTACKLDELRFWSRARNGGAVLSTMNQIVEPSKSLVACYRFDDGGRGIEDSAYYPWDQRYDLGGTNVPDLLIDAKPGPDGKWRTADDIAAGVGSDGQNDYVTCSDAAPVSGMLDSDADGLPNWWESLFGKGAGMDPAKDDDKDGLNNLYEYYVNTNPKDFDTDDNGILDSQEDFDHDGLSNLQEQELGSRPDLTDTDDDGISDGNEAGVPYRSPTDALSPIIDRVLQVNAGGYVEMPADTRFAASSNWTVGAWVNPTNLTAATVIGRQVEANVWNYNLSLNASGQVIAMFTPGDRTANVSVTSSVAVAAGTWTHLAASFDAGSGYLSVYLNGTVRGHVYTGKRPAFSGVGPTWTRTGQGLNGSLDEVAVYSTCLSDVALQATMAGVKSQTAATPACYYRFDDGTSATNDGAGNWVGTSGKSDWNRGQVQDFAPAISLNDWNTGWQHGGTLVGSVNIALAPVDAPVNYGAMDSDSDGLTDWWEQANGLDFNNATGINGPYSDPDADGLNNLAEFKAGTNPHWADTYSFGAPDYYLWAITNKVIFGERFTDHDFMDDAWEFAHFVQDELDPQRYDAQMDADGDGWSNYAEFMAGTDPATTASHPMPSIAGTITYNGFKTGSNVVVHAYQNPDISGNPFVGTSVGLANNYWTFSLAANAPVYIASETIGTTPMQSGYFLHGNVMPGSVVIILGSSTNGVYVRDNGNGHIGNGTIDYATGAWTYPLSGTIVLGTAITASYSYNPIIGLKEGPVYLQAFMDLNANGRFDTGEPAGIAEGQPFNLEWNDLGGVEIALTDNALGYGRFSWPPFASSLSNRVTISSTALGGASPLSRWLSPARSYMDEQDFIQLGYPNGLPVGSYTWALWQKSLSGFLTSITNGTFAFAYDTMAAPTLIAPVGNELRQYTRNTFKFAADGN
ncbi:MAG: LamG-like jellyroll fold domain-containing protein, partial [bacterium]